MASESLQDWDKAKTEWEKWKCASLNISIPKLYLEELNRVIKELKKRQPRANRSRFIVEALVKQIKEAKRDLGMNKKDK